MPQPSSALRRIVIMGTPVTCGNRGVMALAASLVQLCAQVAPEAEISLLASEREHFRTPFRVGGRIRTVAVVPVRLSPRSRLADHLGWIVLAALLYRLVSHRGFRASLAARTPAIKCLAEADLVGDIRGGDSFSDIYGLRRFLLSSTVAGVALLMKGTLVQFPQTYGPYRSGIARAIAVFLLRHSSVIWARDRDSQRLAQRLVGSRRLVELSPDVAFALEACLPAEVATLPPHPGPMGRPIGVNVSGLLFNGGYTGRNMFGLALDYPDFTRRVIQELLARSEEEIWLVPHTFAAPGHVEDDRDAARRLRDSLSPADAARVRLVVGDYDQHALKGIIGQCSFFLGARMHACIGALSQGVPTVGLAYSAKFAGVFACVGMDAWVIDGRSASTDAAVERVLHLYAARTRVADSLRRHAEAARAQVHHAFACRLGPASPIPPTASHASAPATAAGPAATRG